MTRNRCQGWANGDTVTYLRSVGTVRAEGLVVIRKNRFGKWYLQIQLKTAGTFLGRLGDYVWPEGWIWGTGQHKGTCINCDQDYLTDDQAEANASFCPPCDRREQQERAKAGTSVRDHRAYSIGSREVRPQAPRVNQADVAALKTQDEKEGIF